MGLIAAVPVMYVLYVTFATPHCSRTSYVRAVRYFCHSLICSSFVPDVPVMYVLYVTFATPSFVPHSFQTYQLCTCCTLLLPLPHLFLIRSRRTSYVRAVRYFCHS